MIKYLSMQILGDLSASRLLRLHLAAHKSGVYSGKDIRMKKIFALLLAAAMLFALCACGSPAPAQSTEPEPAEEAETVSFQKGTIDGNTYESKLFGIGCTLDESWTIADDEQLAQLMGTVSDVLSSDEDMTSFLESGNVFYDLYATNSTTGASISINVTKAGGFLVGAQLSLMSKQDIIDTAYDEMIAANALDTISSSTGMTDAEMSKGTIQFCGEEYPCILISGTIASSGVELPFNETMIYLVGGNYIGTLVVGDFSGDAADILSGFHTL